VTFTLRVDGPAWRQHTAGVRDALRQAIRGGEHPARLGDLVPVAKGNGYGLGLGRLADEATRLGVDRLAVGSIFEVAEVAQRYAGDILVLTPWDPRDTVAAERWEELRTQAHAARVIRTVSDVHAAKQVPAGARIVLEGITSMRRFGMLETDVLSLVTGPLQNALAAGDIRLEGLALHLPLAMPEIHNATGHASTRVVEVQQWAKTWRAALDELARSGCPLQEHTNTLWVSHLTDEELQAVRALEPDVALNARVGTRLWLGDGAALRAQGTILAVHPVARRFAVGYRQRKAKDDGLLLVVGGGTSHGVAMAAPTPAASLRQRAIAAGTGALEAAGRSRSPFTWGDRLLWFAEPPHMQVSMLWLPDTLLREGTAAGQRTPAVGDVLECRVRHTTALFDAVLVDG
jgi:hypothetical protein